jgi:hypothetical protein
VQQRLQSLSARVRHLAGVEGALWALILIGIFPLVEMGADLLFDLSIGVRGLFLGLGTLLLLGLLFHFAVRPWRRRLGPDEAALLAEKRWPELRTSLISAVQLARTPDGSPFLVDALLGQTAKRIEQMDLRAAVERKHLKRLASIALAALLILVGSTWIGKPKSLVLWQRFFLKNVPLPTQTIVVPISGDFEIQSGETVELSARAQGVIPRTGRAELTYSGKSPDWVTITPKATTRDIFTLTIPNVQQPLSYRFYLNDGRGPASKVVLVQPPVIQSLKFEQAFPPYTGLPRIPLSPGNLSLLAGSRLQVSGRSDQSLRAAALATKGEEKTVPLKLDDQRRSFSGELPIPAKDLSGFSVALQNERGVKASNNAVYAIEIVPDKPPEITLAAGQPAESTIIPTAHPRLRFTTRDDFQVKQVSLCVQPASTVGEGEAPDPAKAKKIPMAIPKPAAALVFDFEWKDPQKSVDWREGTVVYYWIEAVDNNDVTGPGVSHTPVRQWTLVSVETKRAELTETLRKHAESIEDLSRTQQDLRMRVEEMLKQEKN